MKKLIFCFLFCLLFSLPALAVDTESVLDALPDAAQDILGEVEIGSQTDGTDLLDKILAWAAEHLSQMLSKAASGAVVAAAVTLLCSLAGALSPDGKTPEYAVLAAALAVTGCSIGAMTGYLTQARNALYDMVDFSRALLPCVAAASAASGHAASGAARYAASSFFMDVLLNWGVDIIVPLLYAYVAAATARAALPNGALGAPVTVIKWLCTTLLTLLCTGFTLYLSVSGAVSGKADAVATGLAKSAISSALPVVGKILSDAAGTYLAGAELIRSAVGVVGLAAVLCVCVGPILSLGLYFLLFKAAAALTEPFSEGRLSKLVGDIGTAYGMALGLVGAGAFMLFLSIVLSTEVFG